MTKLLVVVCVFAALLNTVLSVCTLDEIGCCISEFTGMIQPSGIGLSEQRVAAVCTFEDETLGCLDVFLDQCSRNETDLKDVEDIVNRTKAYISQICPPTSDFMTRKFSCDYYAKKIYYTMCNLFDDFFCSKICMRLLHEGDYYVSKYGLKEKEICIMNATEKFQGCYNKTILPSFDDSDEERTKKECCEYKELRNCVVQAVEDACGATASQLVHEEVVHINGAVLEWSCSDVFSKCGNAAGMLASSALLLLYSVIVFKWCLNCFSAF